MHAFGTLMVKPPLMSVTTPLVVPFKVTLTPGNGRPFSSVTFPLKRESATLPGSARFNSRLRRQCLPRATRDKHTGNQT